MKTRKFEKRLKLNKETVIDLNMSEMVVAKGGKVAALTPLGSYCVCSEELTVCNSNPCC